MMIQAMRPTRRARFAPMMAMAMVLMLVMGFSAGPILAVAEHCAKPCCAESSLIDAQAARDTCCDHNGHQAPDQPAPSPCSDNSKGEDSDGECPIELCCNESQQGAVSPTSPTLREAAGHVEHLPWHALLTHTATSQYDRIHNADGVSPATRRLHVQLCTFLI